MEEQNKLREDFLLKLVEVNRKNREKRANCDHPHARYRPAEAAGEERDFEWTDRKAYYKCTMCCRSFCSKCERKGRHAFDRGEMNFYCTKCVDEVVWKFHNRLKKAGKA